MKIKYFICFVISLCCLGFLYTNNSTSPNQLLQIATTNDAKMQIFTKQKYQIQNCTWTDYGSGFYATCDSQNAYNILSQIDNVVGVSVVFNGNENDVETISKLLNLSTIKKQDITSELTTRLGYSPSISTYSIIDGERCNVQIALHNGIITLGCPMILGSY